MYLYIWQLDFLKIIFEGLIAYVSSPLAMLQFLITSIQINHTKTAIILHKNVFNLTHSCSCNKECHVLRCKELDIDEHCEQNLQLQHGFITVSKI